MREPAGNHGICIRQNRYSVQDDEYNYHDSLQACRIEGIGIDSFENFGTPLPTA